jgi:large subunit ribosomal protein L29
MEDLQKKSASELGEEEKKIRKELFDLQFKHSTRQLSDTMQIRRTRRQLARVLTVATQKRTAATATTTK